MKISVHRSYGRPSHQQGAATLVVAVVLLFLITIVSVITAQTVVVENQVTGNQQREMQAYNAAQAGLDYFTLLLGLGEINAATGRWSTDPDDPPAMRFLDNEKVVYVDGDCVPGTLAQFSLAPVAVPDMPGFYDVTASGFSADCLGRRVISQRVSRGANTNQQMDRVPLVAGGGVEGGSAAFSVANPENNFTIWSGDSHNPGNSLTLISDPANPCDYSNTAKRLLDCLPTGSAKNNGLIRDNSLSVISSDQNLATLRETPDAFFENFLGRPPEDFKHRGLAQRLSVDEAKAEINKVMKGGRYWVDGSLSLNGGTIGCSSGLSSGQECGRAGHSGTEKPSLVIIEGDFTITGPLIAYGLIYVRGSLSGSGNVRVYGSIIVENEVEMGGNVDVFFSSSVLDAIEPIRMDLPAVVPGTWRDWDA